MLSFRKPAEKQPDATLDDVPAQHAEEAHPGHSAASTLQAQPASQPRPAPPTTAALLAPPSPVHPQASVPSVLTHSSSQGDPLMQTQSHPALPYSPAENSIGKDPRRFSFPSFSFLRPDSKNNPRTASPSSPSEKRAGRALSVLIVGSAASSEKRARESAVVARSVIIGDHNPPKSNKTKPPSKSDVTRLKTQLLEPKSAAKVITQLRTLSPLPDDPPTNTNVPIHAVCLSKSDSDAHTLHFAQLESVATASISAVSAALTNLHIIDLVTAPNMGLGAPASAPGLFAGAVPTAETVIEGIEQITPQLMALGYATGKAILPDHKGVFPPTDRISVLTYWWGFDLCLPPATISFLEAAESPSSALLNLLTAISVLNEGVREIIPFIRYIAQFVQTEWSLVKRADEGKGVVCTATWLVPVALVPRPWDFPDRPPSHTELATTGQTMPTSPSVKRFPAPPNPSTEVPGGAPRPSSTYSTVTGDEDEPRSVISSVPPVLPELVVSSPGSIDGAPRESVDEKGYNAHDEAQHNGEVTPTH